MLYLAAAVGLLVAYVDSRPTWDDTGVTAAAVALTACILAFASSSRPWLIALAVGVWIPLHAIATAANFGSLLALVFALGGAYLGFAMRGAKNPLPA